MSLRYRNSQGTETPVAGLNGTSGELVPSVSLYQSGTAVISMPSTSELTDLFTTTVTFDTPFDDTDYVLNVDQCEVSEAEINRVYNKTTTGFTVAVMYNRKLTAVPSYNVTARLPWSAFKLMTDTVHEADAAHIAQNTANFAPAFSEVTSYAVGDYCTYNNILYRCTTAHTAGTWVAGHFTAVTVGGELTYRKGTSPINSSESSNFDEGYCRYEETNTHILISGRVHCDSDIDGTHSVFINLPAVSGGDIVPVVVTNSTDDIGTNINTYARYEGTTLHFKNVKKGNNRFSAVYVKS